MDEYVYEICLVGLCVQNYALALVKDRIAYCATFVLLITPSSRQCIIMHSLALIS